MEMVLINLLEKKKNGGEGRRLSKAHRMDNVDGKRELTLIRNH